MSNGFWAFLITIAIWAVVFTAALTGNPLALVLLAYAVVGYFTTKNLAARRKAEFPDVPLDGFDLFWIVFLAGLAWPIGWPTSFLAFPSLRSYSRVKRVRKWDRLNRWADKALDGGLK